MKNGQERPQLYCTQQHRCSLRLKFLSSCLQEQVTEVLCGQWPTEKSWRRTLKVLSVNSFIQEPHRSLLKSPASGPLKSWHRTRAGYPVSL